MFTSPASPPYGEECPRPSRPFVVRASTSAGTMLHDYASFITRRVTTDLLSTLDERA
jgi:hypothetical protein